jgi:hypothetical protein
MEVIKVVLRSSQSEGLNRAVLEVARGPILLPRKLPPRTLLSEPNPEVNYKTPLSQIPVGGG